MTAESTFKDHFSGRAVDYTRYRPTYPSDLFVWLAGQTRQHDVAWDCGCGNGQAAIGLVPHYRLILATDPSAQQIENAVPHEHISYGVASAEDSGIAPASVDLIVVAQALHWFNFDRFYEEVRRVARPDGVLAAISYGEVRVEGAADEVIHDFYHNVIGPYWPPERRYVDDHYTTIPFPFAEITTPSFAMEVEWDLQHLLGYLKTWSAVKEYEHNQGQDPLALIAEKLEAAWGDPRQVRKIRWPLSLRIGRVGA